MRQYFPKPYEPFGGDIIVKVDLSNYARKADLKNATGIDTSELALKSNSAGWNKSWNVDKLKSVPVDLSKLSNLVKQLVLLKRLCMVCFKN